MNKVILLKKDGTQEVIDNKYYQNLDVFIKGNNNICMIGEGIRFINTKIIIEGNNNYFRIGSTKGSVRNAVFNMGFNLDDRTIEIGKDFDCGNCLIIANAANRGVYIGDKCIFSDGIQIRTADGHVIYDLESKNAVNKTLDDIRIGSHVWVGRNVFFGKNSGISDDSVVGYGSCVTKKYSEKNIVIAGIPAKIIRKNINWSKQSIESYECEYIRNNVTAVIPARFQSSRFPGKPLAKILGKPMIQWVYERVSRVEAINEVFVATDNQEIYDVVTNFGGNAILTGECKCGTDRVYEAVKNINADIVLNIQGDEPLIKKEMIESIIAEFRNPDVNMVTLKKKITDANDVDKANVVKVITDIHDDAIYFSRCPIPFDRDGTNEGTEYYKHIGIYGYTKNFLNTFVNLKRSNLECMENLEQLRAIENGYKIRVIETQYESVGVDLPEHIALVEAAMKKEG